MDCLSLHPIAVLEDTLDELYDELVDVDVHRCSLLDAVDGASLF